MKKVSKEEMAKIIGQFENVYEHVEKHLKTGSEKAVCDMLASFIVSKLAPEKCEDCNEDMYMKVHENSTIHRCIKCDYYILEGHSEDWKVKVL